MLVGNVMVKMCTFMREINNKKCNKCPCYAEYVFTLNRETRARSLFNTTQFKGFAWKVEGFIGLCRTDGML